MEPIEQDDDQTSTLGEWVKFYLKLDKKPASVFEVNLRLAVKAMGALNAVRCRLDEEGLTASLVGSLAAALPLSVLAFGADDAGGTFGWAQYSKHGRQPFSESQKGADFGLVVTLPNGRLRIALFQAKSDASQSAPANTIYLDQSKIVEVNGIDEEVFQVEKLASYASLIMKKAGYKRFGTEKAGWVHYLCYLQGGVRCVQMSTLSEQISRVLAKKLGCGSVRVNTGNSVSFLTVLGDALEAKPKYWIEISKSDADQSFPDLISMEDIGELMDLYVSDDGKSVCQRYLWTLPIACHGWAKGHGGVSFQVTKVVNL